MTEVKSCLYDLTIIINGCILHWFKDRFLCVLIIWKESFNRNSKDKIYDEEWFFLSFLGITMIWIIFDSNKFYNLVHLMSRVTKRDWERERKREVILCEAITLWMNSINFYTVWRINKGLFQLTESIKYSKICIIQKVRTVEIAYFLVALKVIRGSITPLKYLKCVCK